MTDFIATSQISQLEKIVEILKIKMRIYLNFDNFNHFQFGLESHFSRSDRKFTNIYKDGFKYMELLLLIINKYLYNFLN